MKYNFLPLSLALFLTQPVLAASPQVCPSIEAIKAVGVHVVKDIGLGWSAYNLKNTYNTNEEWSFLIYGIQAQDEKEALIKANNSIELLTLYDGPTKDGKEWSCNYVYHNEATDELIGGTAMSSPIPNPTKAIVRGFRR